jgi:hypothetical protein
MSHCWHVQATNQCYELTLFGKTITEQISLFFAAFAAKYGSRALS